MKPCARSARLQSTGVWCVHLIPVPSPPSRSTMKVSSTSPSFKITNRVASGELRGKPRAGDATTISRGLDVSRGHVRTVTRSSKEEETNDTTGRMMKVQTDGGPGRQSASLTLTLPGRTFGLLGLLTLAIAAAALADTSLLPLTEAEESLCGKKSAVPACRMKLSMCAPLDLLLTPLLGSPQTILSCANATGMPLKSDFLAYLGRAMLTGSVDLKMTKKPTGDPLTDYAIRQCILNSTGMLGGDLQLNREAIAAQVAGMSPPSLRAVVELAIDGCPEPVDLKVKDYLKCLKKTCVASIPDPTPVPPSFGNPFSDGKKSGGLGGLGGMGTI